jgi:cell wall-associated NlpC family hydrolase
MLRRLLLAVGLFLCTCGPAAAAASPVVVLGPDGHVIARGGTGPFDYPEGGSIVHIGSAAISSAGVRLDDVSLLGGSIQVVRVFVPRHARAARVEGLYVAGKQVAARVNRLIPLGGTDYLITSQAAVTRGGALGLVGLRVSLGAPAYSLPAGSQILVGLPVAPSARAKRSPVARVTRTAAPPLAVLGFGDTTSTTVAVSPVPFFSSGPTGRRAVAIAGRLLGIPYLWAGASPVTGFDCSGLTMYVYAQLGIQLTHYTGSQFHEGMPVARDQLQPGDLVFFFASRGVPGHEGMYIGNNQFIQAPHTGDVVKISSLSDPNYALGYVGDVRPYKN